MSTADRAIAAALAGRLVVIPTDTVYGIGSRPDDPEATARIFAAKRRPPDVQLPVLVPSIEAAGRIGRLGEAGRSLAERFWPGPLTLVVPRTAVSRTWPLGEESATVGLRMPGHPAALAVLDGTGPLAVTSANRSGEPTPETCEDIKALFGDAVAVYVCAEGGLAGPPSTVVDVTQPEPRILRQGAIPAAEVLAG